MNESATVLILLKQWDRITDRDGALYRRITMPNCDNERPRADDDWVEKHQRRLRDAHRMARVHLQQHTDDRKQRYDRRAGDLRRRRQSLSAKSTGERQEQDPGCVGQCGIQGSMPAKRKPRVYS